MTASHQIPQTFIDYRVADAVATITLQRPGTGNALNWALLEQLRGAVNRAIKAVEVEAIVIAATGNAFVSGADLGYFVRCMERHDIRTIVKCIRASQEVFDEIANSKKPTVAAVNGAAVGGGVELALACRNIVATPRASFSFPETALSILPFSGGTYRLPDRVGIGLAKWMVYTGQVLLAAKALQVGLVDRLVMPGELSAVAHTTAKELCSSLVVERRLKPRAVAVSQLEAQFAQKSIAELQTMAPEDDGVVGSREMGAALKMLKSHSAIALRTAESLFDATALTEGNARGAELALELVPALFERHEVYELLAQAAVQQKYNVGRRSI
jgi:enoyl-CoA hydratase/carnithine racemase